MQLSFVEFKASCKKLIAYFPKEDWTWVDYGAIGYLKRNNMFVKLQGQKRIEECKQIVEVQDEIGEIISSAGSIEDEDDSVIPALHSRELLETEVYEIEVHIVHSPTFSVPTLYFRVLTPTERKLLPYEKVMQFVLNLNQDKPELKELNQFMFITQGEHPVVGGVFYFLHPCKTAEFMEAVTTGNSSTSQPFCNEDYVISWLSFCGPVLNIEVPSGLNLKAQV